MSRGRVLVVDDEAVIREVVGRAILGEVDRVLEASSGEESLTIAAADRPDLILLDLGLPDMDGIEVC